MTQTSCQDRGRHTATACPAVTPRRRSPSAIAAATFNVA